MDLGRGAERLREARGRGSIAGCCAQRLGALRRALYPLTWVQRQRPAAPTSRMAASAGGDGARGWTSGRRGERPRRDLRGLGSRSPAVAHSGWGSQACSLSVDLVQRQRPAAPTNQPGAMELGLDLARRAAATRPTGSRLDRRAVAHSGWGSQACSLSVDLVQRQRPAAPTTMRMDLGLRGERPRPTYGGDGSIAGLLRTAVGGLRRPLYPLIWVQRQRPAAPTTRGWSSGWGASGRDRPTGLAARSPGCCAQRLGVSGVLSIR